MKKAIFIFMALVCLLPMVKAQAQTAILGYSDIGVVRLTNLTGTVLDSAVQTGTSDDFLYEITVLSKEGVWSTIQVTDPTKQTYRKYTVKDTSARTDIITNFRIRFNSTLSVGSRCRVKFSRSIPVAADSSGSLRHALWDAARADTLENLSGTERTFLLNTDYPRGLALYANIDLQFRTNRITNWVFVPSGNSVYLPIRHITTDTMWVKTATIPNMCILRGN